MGTKIDGKLVRGIRRKLGNVSLFFVLRGQQLKNQWLRGGEAVVSRELKYRQKYRQNLTVSGILAFSVVLLDLDKTELCLLRGDQERGTAFARSPNSENNRCGFLSWWNRQREIEIEILPSA